MSTSTIVYGLYQGQLLPHRLEGYAEGWNGGLKARF